MYAGASPGHPVQALYVAESEGGWAGRLRAALGIPVHAYDPLGGSAPDVPESLRGRFAGAVGLLAAKAAGSIPINFAAPRQPIVQKDPNRSRYLVAALLAVLVLAAGGFYGFMMLSAADDRLASLQRDKDELDKQVKALEPDAKRLDAALKWKARQVNWLDELFDATERHREAAAKVTNKQKFFATSFKGTAVPPEAKTAKQPYQAKIDLKLTTGSFPAVEALQASIRRESKYYSGVGFTVGGPAQSDPLSKEYTIFATGVKGRSPDDYTRFPAFVPPVRKYYPPRPTSAVRDEPAPAPKEKPDAESEG
jgi:hypothetical protein